MTRPAVPDAAVPLLAVAALMLLAWDLGAADVAVMQAIGTPSGFPLRDAFVPSVLLHGGGRWLSGLWMTGWVLWAVLGSSGPPRRRRRRALGVAIAALVLVPAMKQLSATSCPWEWTAFGGGAQWVSHWRLGVGDGGSGHCFPSGHAAAAFAFLPGYFMLRGDHPRAARVWLQSCLLLGVAFGAAQVVRGAHPPSHIAWTAWLCAAISLAGDRRSRRPWRSR